MDSIHLQHINEQITAIKAKVDQIKEESTRTKRVIRDLCLPFHLQVLALKEVCNTYEEQFDNLQSQQPTELMSNMAEDFTQ